MSASGGTKSTDRAEAGAFDRAVPHSEGLDVGAVVGCTCAQSSTLQAKQGNVAYGMDELRSQMNGSACTLKG